MAHKMLFATALLLLSGPAVAAVTVIGDTSARLCYESAEARVMPEPSSLARCDVALSEENLSEADRTATLVNRGILRMRMNRFPAAHADFDAAIARDPGQAEAYVNKGMAMIRQGDDWDGAIAQFNTALERRTRRPAVVYFGRAFAYEMKGRVKAAYLDYREANRLEPSWRDPKAELARFTVQRP